MDPMESLGEIRRVKEGAEDELLELPGVFGVDIGFKEVGGRRTEELAIRVLVEEKKDVPDEERVPLTIGGVKTDVIQRGRPFFAQSTAPDTGKYNPLVGGISIGQCGGPPGVGTCGAIVIDNDVNLPMMLSNWHVLVRGRQAGRVPVAIAQPASEDNGSCVNDIAGRVAQNVINEEVDAAVAFVTTSNRGVAFDIAEIGRVAGTSSTAFVSIDQPVIKRGRTTGLTFGRVSGIDVTITIADWAGNLRKFIRQIEIVRSPELSESFIKGGDSGSVLVESRTNRVLGLLFAGSRSFTPYPQYPEFFIPEGVWAWANPIETVLRSLNVRMGVRPKGKEKGEAKEKDQTKERKDLKDGAIEQDPVRLKLSVEARLLEGASSTQSTAPTELPTGGPLEERLSRLAASVDELQHFIGPESRPDLSSSALAGESDLGPQHVEGDTVEEDTEDVPEGPER